MTMEPGEPEKKSRASSNSGPDATTTDVVGGVVEAAFVLGGRAIQEAGAMVTGLAQAVGSTVSAPGGGPDDGSLAEVEAPGDDVVEGLGRLVGGAAEVVGELVGGALEGISSD